MNTMHISRLAERSGVPATTLRFYERTGLLPAERTPSGYRIYGDDALERLTFIGAAKRLGLSLEEIAELLAVRESGTCTHVKSDLRSRIETRIAEAASQAAELSAFTAVLHSTLEHLAALPDRETRCGPECGFPAPDPTAPTGPACPPRDDADGDGERWRTAAVACSLTGDGVAERAAEWQELISGAQREEIEDGVRLVLPAALAGRIAALAAAEQHCCPFYDFHLHLDGPVVRLEVRAPAEAADMLAELFTPVA